MFRLAKARGYEHIEDFFAEYPNGPELMAWIAYERLEDEIQKNRLMYAFGKVLYGEKQQSLPEKDVIDTTDPDFAKYFQGITYGDRPKPRPPKSTQIVM